MSTPGEHKTVQARILAYAQEVGWSFVSREEAEQRRGFEPPSPSGLRRSGADASKATGVSLFCDDLIDAQVRVFNPRYAEAEGACIERWKDG
jgi:type I restriction enzyme R subunit